MGDQVQLSAYSEAIENLIRSEQYDQAIALCQHILCYYPKSIVTYRQMAQAALEKGDHHSAAELFRRVLSADPENYVAYAGLGIIFEGQGLVDEAIWHLERAFELRPNIPQIRNELLRLYGERDGRPHTRLRLTPGALARLYVREGLFAQAIQEFRGILSQAPRRLDVRLAMAETLWHAGQMRDATQVCQEVLQALPNCLKANLILGKALQESESGAEAGAPYLNSAEALDPTNRVAEEIFGDQSPLKVTDISVPEYVERAMPAPGAEATPPATEQAPAQAGGFDDWFAGTPPESEGLHIPGETPTTGEATVLAGTPFEPWTPAPEEPSQEIPAWVSEISVPSEPAESPAAETLPSDQTPTTAEEASVESQPQPAAPQQELPPWLLSDFGLAPSPAASTPKPTIPVSSSLPPWLTEFQKTHQVDSSTPPTTQEAKHETLESSPGWTAEPLESGAALPAAEEKTSTSQAEPSWEPISPQATEELSRPAEPTESLAPAEQAVVTPESIETAAPSEPAPFEITTAPAAEEETPAELPDWLQTLQAQVAAGDAGITPPPGEELSLELPDWLKGLQEDVSSGTAARAEEGAVEEPKEQEGQPLATTEPREELEAEAATEAPPWLHEKAPAESDLVREKETAVQQTESPSASALAPEAPVEPAEVSPEGESEPIILEEEAADRELYGDQVTVAAPETEQAAGESVGAGEPTPPAPAAPAPVEAKAEKELPPTEMLRRRRDPKGYSQLVQARAFCQENRLGEALKEYDYLVQHSPRLVNAVIEDLEELVQRQDVPLEAHRILGDAYTRADRLADALERYRFVLERVS